MLQSSLSSAITNTPQTAQLAVRPRMVLAKVQMRDGCQNATVKLRNVLTERFLFSRLTPLLFWLAKPLRHQPSALTWHSLGTRMLSAP